MEEFQYIDIWQIDEGKPSRPECLGPTFHLKPNCPICDSCYSDLYCSACVRSGAYSVVAKSKEELKIQEHPHFHGAPNCSKRVRCYFYLASGLFNFKYGRILKGLHGIFSFLIHPPDLYNKTGYTLGPEPTTSSHVALAHAVVAARTTAKLFDVWLPPSTRRLLCLENVFSGDFALRDNLAHAYLTVARAVQMICTVCGLTCLPADKLSWLGLPPDGPRAGAVGFKKPLTGLYVLCQAMQKLAFIGKSFDEPYFLELDTYEDTNLFEDTKLISLSLRRRQCRSVESPCRKGSPEHVSSHNDSVSCRKLPDEVQSRLESDEDVKSDGAHSTSLDWEFVDSDHLRDPYILPSDHSFYNSFWLLASPVQPQKTVSCRICLIEVGISEMFRNQELSSRLRGLHAEFSALDSLMSQCSACHNLCPTLTYCAHCSSSICKSCVEKHLVTVQNSVKSRIATLSTLRQKLTTCRSDLATITATTEGNDLRRVALTADIEDATELLNCACERAFERSMGDVTVEEMQGLERLTELQSQLDEADEIFHVLSCQLYDMKSEEVRSCF
ncbi:unnamed protein product [Dibothriocephalus latus]|uniref:Uncharacterized protein n=1 Tax=Dibothriocephalus latus TaxID=60516 RepID=A0A3P6TZK9_DIBLA|nr:unnamed protein product [Dibothriocephalus latus]